ncbi:MAG TPA: S1 RNA-binding domain-containing protein, partial [Pirellulales bacterium]
MSSDPRLPVSDRPGEASSPSASSSGQPAGTGADVTTPSAESTPAETATGDPNTGKPRGLKIGSQRVDYNAPRPAPLTPSTPAAATNAPAPAAPGSTPQIFPAQGSNPPPDEGKRRRRRDDSPPKREAPLVVERNVPLPNLRKDPADIERELEAALAGASFDDLMGSGSGAAPLAKLERDARVQGVVSAVHGDDVFLDLPGKAQGVVHIKTFAEPPAVGTAMEVVVGGYNEEEGLYAVHLPGQAAPDAADWSEVAEGLTVEARITSVNKGGLEATVGTLRAFIPAGQASLYRIEDLSTLVGEKLLCVVTECKPERRNLVLSRRAV